MTDIEELIYRRRNQILVHSCIYYKFDQNLISDSTFDKWAHELAELQEKYPAEAAGVPYAEEFADFDGNSGAFLPYDRPNIVATAELLLQLHKQPERPAQERKIPRQKKLF